MSPSKLIAVLVVAVLIVSVKTARWRSTNFGVSSKNLFMLKSKIWACSGKFLCDYGNTPWACDWKCIDSSNVCDDKNDCIDQSDEMGCPAKPTPLSCPTCEMKCTDRQFTCRNGTCIPIEKICDDNFDCVDGSDETGDICNKCSCKDNQYQCHISKKCIELSQKCDGHMDCGENDTSDEPDNCKCKINTTTPNFCSSALPSDNFTIATYFSDDLEQCVTACRRGANCQAIVRQEGVACYLRENTNNIGMVPCSDDSVGLVACIAFGRRLLQLGPTTCPPPSLQYYLCDFS